MREDITDILGDWEYDPDDLIRIVSAEDGREVLQVRQPLGIEQYEMDGRPDGLHPFDKESFLHEYMDRISSFDKDNNGTKDFSIEHEDFLKLQNEGILYYYRYLILFQIGDFERTVSDTEHNLLLCEIIEKYMKTNKDKKEILQYKPYILRINAISRAMLSLRKELKVAAEKIIESTIEIIKNMPPIETPAFQFEKIRSLHSLKATLKQIKKRKISPVGNLRTELEKAVEVEDYERAAELRDKIVELSEQK